MAAGLGFKTFTTGEVLTAADTNGYLMQGVLVFADAAARTAAITSPQEGQMSYLKDTNSTEYYSGSAWTAVAGASGGMTLISTTTLTGASITLSSIPATYNSLRLVIRNFLPATDGTTLQYRFNADATASRHANVEAFGGAGSTGFSATSCKATEGSDNAVAQGLVVIDFPDYANTTSWKMSFVQSMTNNSTTTTNFMPLFAGGYYNQIGAISSFSLFPASGNFTSGTALLYGVK